MEMTLGHLNLHEKRQKNTDKNPSERVRSEDKPPCRKLERWVNTEKSQLKSTIENTDP